MCGRYMLYYEKDVIIDAFNLINDFDYEERFNIAPSQEVLTIIKSNAGNRAGYMQWGLIPSWSKDPKIGNKLMNARGESIHEKPSFKDSFYTKRCLVPASGFYEWKKEEGKKQPYHIFLEGQQPFAFAGIWSRWIGEISGERIEKITCSILTKEANTYMGNYHHRMPVMLKPSEGELWLGKDMDQDSLLSIINSNDPDLKATKVSQLVNRPDHDRPECIKPLIW